jgi:hypothetical protein
MNVPHRHVAFLLALLTCLAVSTPSLAQTNSQTPAAAFTQGVACSPNGTLAYNANGFVSCASGAWAVQPVAIGTASSAPYTCSSTYQGMMYFDTGATTVKYCNGTSWGAFSSSCTVSSGTQYQLGYYATTGSAISGESSIITDSSSDLILSSGTLAIGTTTITNAINIAGQTAQTIGMVRETTASTGGNTLTLQAGGGTSGGTNLSGGNLLLSSGISTGTQTSNILFDIYSAGSTGTTDDTQVTMLTLSGTGSASTGQGTLATTLQATAGSGTDENGGSLTLASGISTGTGTSNIIFNIYKAAGSSNGSNNGATTAVTITNTGAVNIASAALGLQLNGMNGISYPTTDTTLGASIAIGSGALAEEPLLASTAFYNVAVGYQAIGSSSLTVNAVSDTAVGYQAMYSANGVNGGVDDVAFGYQALYRGDIGGGAVTAVGAQALYNGSSGDDVAVGYQAMYNYGTGGTAVGYQALYNGGYGGTAFGYQALYNNNNSSGQYNTAIGSFAGNKLTSGSNNVAIGSSVAGTTLTTGSNNILIGVDSTTDTYSGGSSGAIGIGQGVKPGSGDIGIGYKALNSTGADNNNNVAIGYQTLTSDTTGKPNTAVGYSALEFNSTGGDNVAMGYDAMLGITGTKLTGSYNTAVGDYALNTIQGAAALNTAIGYQALFAATSASNNTAFGSNTLLSNTTGSPNTAVGSNALSFNTTGADNVAIGSSAMLGITGTKLTGSFNTAVGDGALFTIQGAAANNTAVGYQALKSATSASSNSALGYQAGFAGTAITTGANDTFVGYQAQANGAAYTNGTALGNGAILTCSNCMTLGNASIATIYAQVTSITAISDRRLKKDIQDLDLGLDFISKLHPVSYRFNNGDETLRYGFIAQELEQALPVSLQDMAESTKPEHGVALLQRQNDEMRTYRVTYGELFAPMVKAIQELKTEHDELEAADKDEDREIETLRANFDAFEAAHH